MKNRGSSPENTELSAHIQAWLTELCTTIPNRHLGSAGNRAATDYFASTLASFGFDTECPEFDCIDWEHGDVGLEAGGERFMALVGPYSLPGHTTAQLEHVSTMEALAATDVSGKILLISGDLAKEQAIPKNFPFYIPSSNPELAGLLERQGPAAIIAATARNPELAGSWYPFPLFEDGDFDIPSVYMTDVEGRRLEQHQGADVTLNFDSRRIPARGCNVIARKGRDFSNKLVFCAHIDTKKGTPGALDNATGIAILLALAELLADYGGNRTIEIVAFNGEDYYAAPGQAQYIELNRAVLDTIGLAVNMDLAGYYGSPTAFSLYGCSESVAAQVRQVLGARHELVEGAPWYQSDHSVFIQNGIPAVAISSENLMELSVTVTHTEKDTLDLVDIGKLVGSLRTALRDLIYAC